MFCITHFFPSKKIFSKDDPGKCAMFIILWLLCSYTPAYPSREAFWTGRTSLPPEGAMASVFADASWAMQDLEGLEFF